MKVFCCDEDSWWTPKRLAFYEWTLCPFTREDATRAGKAFDQMPGFASLGLGCNYHFLLLLDGRVYARRAA